MATEFTCLYFLENTDMYIIEVKRTDLSNDVAINDRIKWLKIRKDNLEIVQLEFIAMDSSEEVEERYFEQGYLKFNHSDGTLIEKYNSAQHPLSNRKNWYLSSQLKNAITEFFI